MAYSSEVVSRAQKRLAKLKSDRESLQWHRLLEAYDRVPRIREIDQQLRKNMSAVALSAFNKDSSVADYIEQGMALQQERQQLINANFPRGYIDEGPMCPHCSDNGYLGSTMCSCLAELCRREQQAELSLLSCGEGRFADFRLDYYDDQIDGSIGISPRKLMEVNLRHCKKFAEDPRGQNLLFVGGTGLGKTFLSACIARELAMQGLSVAYEPAGRLFTKLEKNRFSPTEEIQRQTEKLYSSDLLIIDDLGTELPGNFVTAALYDLLNERLLAGKPMIVSTNLLISEIATRYSPQIASRLQGSFKTLTFKGRDIRLIKNDVQV